MRATTLCFSNDAIRKPNMFRRARAAEPSALCIKIFRNQNRRLEITNACVTFRCVCWPELEFISPPRQSGLNYSGLEERLSLQGNIKGFQTPPTPPAPCPPSPRGTVFQEHRSQTAGWERAYSPAAPRGRSHPLLLRWANPPGSEF